MGKSKDLAGHKSDELRAILNSPGELMIHPDEASAKTNDAHLNERRIAADPLQRHKPLSELYGPKHLLDDRSRELLNIGQLPSWHNALERDDANFTTGHGLGKELNNALGGIGPGYILGVAAAAAKAGKTAFIHQLADGLAMRSAEIVLDSQSRPLTPVILLSEMPPRDLSWRSLARMTGSPANWFRAGGGAVSLAKNDERLKSMWGKAEQLLSPWEESDEFSSSQDSKFQLARSLFSRVFQTRNKGRILLDELRTFIWAWSENLKQDPQTRGREVWPVIMIDPIQRLSAAGKNAVEAADEFSDELNEIARAHDWIVLLTSDATKESAMGKNRDKEGGSAEEEGAGAFRGSYTLQHVLDAALYLRPTKEGDQNDNFRELEAVLVFNRWGPSGGSKPRFSFHRPTMRMYPHFEGTISL